MKVSVLYNGKEKELNKQEFSSEDALKKSITDVIGVDCKKPVNQALKFEKLFKPESIYMKFKAPNLGTITGPAYDALRELDESFVGSYHYMGLGWFWNYEYRHYLRDASRAMRVRIHTAFLKAGLKVYEESEQHLSIIERIKTNE